MLLRHGSLCTGILGLDLAVAQHFDAELAWYSEIEPAPTTVIEREHPGVANLGDLTKIVWADVPPVDVLTAGYPCQPFSHAGNRKGTADDRHLWPYIADAVRVLRPRRVVLENVAGHLSLGFDVVLGDLAEAGFDAEWCVLRASDVGAPHQRARLFVVARDTKSDDLRHGDESCGDALAPPGRSQGATSESSGGAAHANGASGRRPRDSESGDCPTADGGRGPEESRGRRSPAADAGGERLAWGSEHDIRTDGPRLEAPRRDDPDGLGDVAWGIYAPAIDRWERTLERPAPAPTDERGRLSPAFVEWMMGYPDGWVDGLIRTQALKALGNAVVPQQALAALDELCAVDDGPDPQPHPQTVDTAPL